MSRQPSYRDSPATRSTRPRLETLPSLPSFVLPPRNNKYEFSSSADSPSASSVYSTSTFPKGPYHDTHSVSDFLDPQRMVTLIAQGRRFYIHEHILISGSRFFSNLFASSHMPSESLEYTFSADEDVHPQDLAHYLNFAYCQTLLRRTQEPIFATNAGASLTSLVTTMQLCDQFHNSSLRSVVGMSIEQILRSGPPCAVAPGARKADDLRAWIMDYGDAYEVLHPDVGYQKEIREAILRIFCGYFPMQEFRKYSDDVSHCDRFVRDLSVRFSEIIAARDETKRKKKWRRLLAHLRGVN